MAAEQEPAHTILQLADGYPPMSVEDVLDRCDNTYFVVKNTDSKFLWANQNFCNLVGQTKEQLLAESEDTREAHVHDDEEVLNSGIPMPNLHEIIKDSTGRVVHIVTQKGLLRRKDTNDVIGVTVNFARREAEWRVKVKELIETLDLKPSGVGTMIALYPPSDITIPESGTPDRFKGPRSAYSANVSLLTSDETLKLHRLNSDELWFHQQGAELSIHCFHIEKKEYKVLLLGPDPGYENHSLFQNAPHGWWFGAEMRRDGYAVCGNSLSPGFDPRDSVIATEHDIEELKKAFPEYKDLIVKLTPKEEDCGCA